MEYALFILILIARWQSVMRGRYSEMLSSGLLMIAVILLIVGLIIKILPLTIILFLLLLLIEEKSLRGILALIMDAPKGLLYSILIIPFSSFVLSYLMIKFNLQEYFAWLIIIIIGSGTFGLNQQFKEAKYALLQSSKGGKKQEIESLLKTRKTRYLLSLSSYVILTIVFFSLMMSPRSDKENLLTCDDGYQVASDYELSDTEECKDYLEDGDARECCEIYILEDFDDADDYFLPKDSFRGYECSDDCSGHQAGYNWALENNIDNEDNCSGNSQSFIEGCYSYVEENF